MNEMSTPPNVFKISLTDENANVGKLKRKYSSLFGNSSTISASEDNLENLMKLNDKLASQFNKMEQQGFVIRIEKKKLSKKNFFSL
jgi:hypothetical protein